MKYNSYQKKNKNTHKRKRVREMFLFPLLHSIKTMFESRKNHPMDLRANYNAYSSYVFKKWTLGLTQHLKLAHERRIAQDHIRRPNRH